MIPYACPHCGTADERPSYMSGKKTVCEFCKKPGVVQAPQGFTIKEPPEPVKAVLAEEPKPAKQAEPWFYGFLEFYALVGTALGVLSGVGIGLAAAADNRLASGLLTGGSVIGTSIFAGSIVLLLLDIGRSLRKQRP